MGRPLWTMLHPSYSLGLQKAITSTVNYKKINYKISHRPGNVVFCLAMYIVQVIHKL